MSIDDKTLSHIAHLARIKLNDDEKPGLVEELKTILEYVEQMEALDLSHVEPLAHPLEQYQLMREDEVTEANLSEQYLALARRVENDLYVVPQVIASES